MLANDDLQTRWWNLEAKLVEKFGKKPDLESILFLIGIQEFGQMREKFTKEQKQDLMHVAVCSLLSQSGYYGKDVRGLIRLHQFDKVEIVQLVHPDKSYEVLDQMVAHVERLLISLELPYRILRLCGGDMGFTSALTYDFEVYSAAQDKWLEVSSVSNFESYQTNRMKIRVKDNSGKTQLVHSLNGSSLALPRILACLLENNQAEDNIRIPAALQAVFGAPELV